MTLRITITDPGPASRSAKNAAGPGHPHQPATDVKGRIPMVGQSDSGNERVFPLPPPDGDSRFTRGLVIEVAAVLARHGYPMEQASGLDYVELQQALYRFLYAPVSRDGGEQS